MKRLFTLMVSIMLTMSVFAAQPKYVFYFIGDGMGMAQVVSAEYFQSQVDGKLGITPLCFASFPYLGMATTYSNNSDVTDSAAGGTALATGNKTNNGVMGMLPDKETPIYSVAVWAKNSGKKVGVSTSVAVNHATPAAFYAHTPSRNDYYKIGQQLPESGFDFFAGGDFLKPEYHGQTPIYDVIEEQGYNVVRGYDEYLKEKNCGQPIVLIQKEGKGDNIPYAIDATDEDLKLDQIVTAGIDQLSNGKKGFFFMCEGGKIDYACHANDGATCIREVLAFDKAIQVAYEFYKKHKNETLIVVTADHETGGMSICNGGADNPLQYQKVSKNGFSGVLNQLRKEKNNEVEWEDIKKALTEYFGFWDKIYVEHDDVVALYNSWYHTFAANDDAKKAESLYYSDEQLASLAVSILNKYASCRWTTGGHSGINVPVYAIGVGAEQFSGQMNNIDIPVKIAKIAGYKQK